MKNPKTKEYSNGEITVLWQPDVCHHSKICTHGLPEVFKPKEKPWIQVENADTEEIAEQVAACPSGALRYFYNQNEDEFTNTDEKMKLELIPNGPLMAYGKVEIKNADGETVEREKVTAFCRCGASGNKPFCDGSHKGAGFEG